MATTQAAETSVAAAAAPDRPFRPPVAGSDNAPFQYIAGYGQRLRSSYGQDIQTILTRFFEFATARQPGSVSYTFQESPRQASLENGYPFILHLSGNYLPPNLADTKKALELLINGCPDMIFSHFGDDGTAGSTPSIFFNATKSKFIQDLEVFESPLGFGLKGNYMLRRSSQRYYAYPFKVYVARVTDTNFHYLNNVLSFEGDFLRFLNGMLDYWDLKLDLDVVQVQDSSLSMKYEGEEIFLTRGAAIANFVPAFGSSMFAGCNGEAIMLLLKTQRFCTSESVIHAMQKVDANNQIKKSIEPLVSMGTVRHADSVYPGMTVAEKQASFKDWLTALLSVRSIGPRDVSKPWGLSYVADREKLKQTVGLIETRIVNAVGREVYDKFVNVENRVEFLDDYLKRIDKAGMEFMHLSEGFLEVDFQKFAEEKAAPAVPAVDEPPTA